MKTRNNCLLLESLDDHSIGPKSSSPHDLLINFVVHPDLVLHNVTVVERPPSDPESDVGRDRKAVKEMLDRLKFPFDSARTIKNTIEILDEFQAEELQKHQRTVVPTSFLIDADRQAMAVYKRAVDLEQVLADMRLFNRRLHRKPGASPHPTGDQSRWRFP